MPRLGQAMIDVVLGPANLKAWAWKTSPRSSASMISAAVEHRLPGVVTERVNDNETAGVVN